MAVSVYCLFFDIYKSNLWNWHEISVKISDIKLAIIILTIHWFADTQ